MRLFRDEEHVRNAYPVPGAVFAPNGQSFVFKKDTAGGGEANQLFRYDLARGTPVMLTDGKSRHGGPAISRTAIVMRTRAQRRPSSSVMSTSHTQVVRPRWRRRASAWIVPVVIGRRNEVWFDIPCAALPDHVASARIRRRISASSAAIAWGPVAVVR